MLRIVYLTFYFKPDLCAGSFRNSSLAIELAKQAKSKNIEIDLYTTLPNRYSSFEIDAPVFEEFENLRIHRIALPLHKSGMIDQMRSFWTFYRRVIQLNKNQKASYVFASSSRLFTAYLGYKIAIMSKAPLYLDIRDIFVDTMNDIFKSKTLKVFVIPFLSYIEKKTFNYASHINLISGGFKNYFKNFKNARFTHYSNGIDDEFLIKNQSSKDNFHINDKKLVVYAGNLGEGQGLHKIIPETALRLKEKFQFLIIGDGGTKKLLLDEIERLNLDNVKIQNPVGRKELINIYNDSDFLFLHLNDYPAFRKVLPSKIFELATFKKPILAGVAGYAAEFLKNEVMGSFVFNPCDANSLVSFLENYTLEEEINRDKFIHKFKRSAINSKMAKSILEYL